MPQTSYASDKLLAGQPSIDAQSQPSSGDQICTCDLCKKSINIKGVVIKCCSCLVNYHLACVVNKFGSAYGTPLRNSIQWLSDFLNDGDFQFVFVCVTSKHKSTNLGISSATNSQKEKESVQPLGDYNALKESVLSLSTNVNIITKQLSELKSSIQAFTDSPTVESVDASKLNLPRKSYADIAATDIIQEVQNAVAQGFKTQKKNDCIEKTIVIYGLPKSKNDIIHVRKLLEDDINSVVQVHRFRKTPSASSSSNQPGSRSVCCPLKVELASN